MGSTCEGRQERISQGQKNECKYISSCVGEQSEPVESPRDMGYETLPRLNGHDLKQNAQNGEMEPEDSTSS